MNYSQNFKVFLLIIAINIIILAKKYNFLKQIKLKVLKFSYLLTKIKYRNIIIYNKNIKVIKFFKKIIKFYKILSKY